MNDSAPDFMTWFRSLSDLEQERVLRRLRTAAEAIVAKHAGEVVTQPPQRNVISAN